MSTNLALGAALIVLGCISVWRSYVGEKAAAVMTLTQPEAGLMNRRDCLIGLTIGVANIVFGMLNLWIGLRHA
jgi:hypothetical protein